MNVFREILSYSTNWFQLQTGARTDQAAKHAKEKRRMTSPSTILSAQRTAFMTFIVPFYRAASPHSRRYRYILMDSQSLHL
jgi:hypothetical protein